MHMKKKLIFILLALGILLFIICAQKKTYILPKSELSIPSGYSEEKWEGVLRKCKPGEGEYTVNEFTITMGCGSCYHYVLEQAGEVEALTFFDEDFDNLDPAVNKEVILTGYITTERITPIKCAKSVVVTKIEIESWLGQAIKTLCSKITF